MSEENKGLLENAKQAVTVLFSDTSVDKQTGVDSLNEVADHAVELAQILQEELDKENE